MADDLALGGCERRGITFGRTRSLLDEDHEERGVEAATLHLAEIDPEPGVRAGIEARLAHVGARDVDVGIESEGRRAGSAGRKSWSRDRERTAEANCLHVARRIAGGPRMQAACSMRIRSPA